MKGIEGLPLKYVVMLLVAAIVLAAVLQVTNMLATLSHDSTLMANATLTELLNKQVGSSIAMNITP